MMQIHANLFNCFEQDYKLIIKSQYLRAAFGKRFDTLSELGRIILATAEIENVVTHTRMKDLSIEHSKDITSELMHLVREGFLEKHGETRGSEYVIPGHNAIRFTQPSLLIDIPIPDITPGIPDSAATIPDNAATIPDNDLEINLKHKLEIFLAKQGKNVIPKRMNPAQMREIILLLCEDRFVEAKTVAAILSRETKGVSEEYLGPMIQEGLLMLRYPETPKHPQQAYRTNKI